MKQLSYVELEEQLKAAPATWLPALLITVVKTSLEKGIFQPGGAAHLAQNVENKFRAPEGDTK